MGRSPKFRKEDISSAALHLVAEGGPRAATIHAIAQRTGAPTGSIYHRYANRDFLLAELWLSTISEYQEAMLAELATDPPIEGAVRAVLFMARWVRKHPLESRLLLLHRRDEFVGGEWPSEFAAQAEELGNQIRLALRRFCRRHFGHERKDARTIARFAVLDVPLGAVKSYLQAGQVPPPMVDELLEETVRHMLTQNYGKGTTR